MVRKYKKKGPSIKFYVADLADWSPKNDHYDLQLKKRVKDLTENKFKNLVSRLLLYSVDEIFRLELQNTLEFTAKNYLHLIKNDMLVLGHGALSIENKAIDEIFQKSMENMINNISEIFRNPNDIQFKGLDYRNTFDQISRLRRYDKNFSKVKLRYLIKLSAYEACGDVKRLCEMRFENKSKVIDFYWSCVLRIILSNPKFAYFLRGSGRVNIDYKDFEDSRNRFIKKHLSK